MVLSTDFDARLPVMADSSGPGSAELILSQAAQRKAIVIIGAGAAGMMAARELSAAGKAVIVLEATGQAGGRIRTLTGNGFPRPVEAGAEFLHGKLPLTLQLLKEAGIAIRPVRGTMLRFSKGEWVKPGMFEEGWDELIEKMALLTEDMPLAEFFSRYLSEERFRGLRESAQRFAEGFDLADTGTVSTFYLFREWQQEDEGQYRIEGGYGLMIQWLVDESRKRGCILHLSAAVKDIEWQKDHVKIVTADGRVFNGAQVIVTASPGALLRTQDAIRFSPAIPAHMEALGKLGFGTVTKILLQFKKAFWTEKDKNTGFLLTDRQVPTWWTQYPDQNALLTGWIPDAVMNGLRELSEEEMIDRSLSSLAPVFALDKSALEQQLVTAVVINWAREPFILGGYSFDTVDSAAARKLINEPIGNSIFFAGEACYEGTAPGTVEAALVNGKEVADKILRSASDPDH